MSEPLTVRAMTDAGSAGAARAWRTAARREARLRDRARICWLSHQGQRVAAIKARGVADGTVRLWITRFNARGAGRLARPAAWRSARDVHPGAGRRAGRRQPDRPAGARACPSPVGRWTGWPRTSRGAGHRHQAQPHRGDPAGRGLALAATGDLVRRAARPGLRRKKGAIVTLYTAPPADSVVVCLDEMGPESAKSFPGSAWCARDPAGQRRAARQAGDRLRPARAGLRLRGLRAGDREAFTAPYAGRTTANFVDFLEQVEALARSHRRDASTPCWTTSRPTAPPTCCSGRWPIPAGSSSSSRSTPPTST